jgi:outer membrane lipoprotein-sorting protein
MMFRLVGLSVLALSLLLGCSNASRREPVPDAALEPASEPYEYSATVITIVGNGSQQRTTTTRVARSGEKRREEWTEDNQKRISIWRPDLGKSFLIDPDRGLYVEVEAPAVDSGTEGEPDAIDRSLGDTVPPDRITTTSLPEETINGYLCAGFEMLVYYQGEPERTRTFRSKELNLPIRTQVERGGVRTTIERRDIQTSVSPDEFNVPSGFRRVPTLGRN